ncbi:unnamed protein product [Arctogadus glacialis]
MGRSRQKENGQNSPEKEAATLSDRHSGGGDALPPDLDKLRAVLLSDLTTTVTTTMKMVAEEENTRTPYNWGRYGRRKTRPMNCLRDGSQC